MKLHWYGNEMKQPKSRIGYCVDPSLFVFFHLWMADWWPYQFFLEVKLAFLLPPFGELNLFFLL